MEEVIWKDIPGYIDCQASSTGLVRKKNRLGEWIIPKVHETKSTSGTYLNYSVKQVDGKIKMRGAHQLVCLAFVDQPPFEGKKYEVNHIDGNKHNNRPENLEWMTRKENIIHSLQNGLRSDNVELEVTDLQTGLVDKYISVTEFLNVWKVSRHIARTLIARHHDEPYRGRWVFKLNDKKLGKIKKRSHSDIICKDYVDNRIIIANNAAELTFYTKVSSVNINNRVGNGKSAANIRQKQLDKLLAGYVFRHLHDNRPWPEYSKEIAIASREAYFSKKLRDYGPDVI